MSTTWLYSDPHFHHEGILRFIGYDGKPLRVFDNVSQMNEHLVTRWNETVKQGDKVYLLGDVSMKHTAEAFKILGKLNGNKTLILGNHDSPDMHYYRGYFKSVYSYRRLDKVVLTHIPIHPMSLRTDKILGNVHGHVHNNITPGQYGPRYYNVSCEVLDDYAPISLEEVEKRIRKQIDEAGILSGNNQSKS